jgi:hypothetical protein
MADFNRRYRINSGDVVHEEVDGELIAIDLTGGSYYSLSGSAPVIWSLLLAGAGQRQISEALADRYDADREVVADAVSGLLEKLVESGLVTAVDDENGGVAQVAIEENGDGGTFQQPVFERYTDMKDYFLLDPIHEVDPAAGWPRPAA